MKSLGKSFSGFPLHYIFESCSGPKYGRSFLCYVRPFSKKKPFYQLTLDFLLFFQVTDLPEEDLLSHFTGSNEFIQGGLAKDGAVLVHCYR